jgi:recombination protein RecA
VLDLKEIAKQLNTELKETVAIVGEDLPLPSDVQLWLPTGITLLDLAIGQGLPGGRVVEIFGAESSGKSSLALQMMVAVQKMGGVAVRIETESSFMTPRAKKFGLRMDDQWIWLVADTLESGVDVLHKFITKVPDDMSEPPVIIVWDTMSLARTEAEKKGESESMAAKAKEVRELMRRIVMELPKRNITFVVLDQTQAVIGGRGASQDTNVGGGIKFAASVRLELYNKGYFVENGTKVGMNCSIKVYKNKVGPPQAKFDVPMFYEDGVSDVFSMFAFLANKDIGAIKLAGAYYKIPEMEKEIKSTLGKREAVEKWIQDYPQVLPWMKEQLVANKMKLWAG